MYTAVYKNLGNISLIEAVILVVHVKHSVVHVKHTLQYITISWIFIDIFFIFHRMRVRVIGPEERESRRKYQAKYRRDHRDDKEWCKGESIRTGVSKKNSILTHYSFISRLLSYVLALMITYHCHLSSWTCHLSLVNVTLKCMRRNYCSLVYLQKCCIIVILCVVFFSATTWKLQRSPRQHLRPIERKMHRGWGTTVPNSKNRERQKRKRSKDKNPVSNIRNKIANNVICNK